MNQGYRKGIHRPEIVYLYAVAFSQEGPVKIGITSDVRRRVEELQCGCPYSLHVYGLWPFKNRKTALEIEAAILDVPPTREKLRGEWLGEGVRSAIAYVEAMMDVVEIYPVCGDATTHAEQIIPLLPKVSLGVKPSA